MAETSRTDNRIPSVIDRGMEHAETVVYLAIGLLLAASAVFAIASVGYHLVSDFDDGTLGAVTAALDGLLLVFILVELFGAVRVTVAERKLLAEPFLIVGIIAAIKEIVVASLKASEDSGDALRDSMTEIGVLGFVVLLLAVGSYLVRRKEREPTEE